MELSDAAGLWDPQPGWLDSASYGLPPRPAWEALQAALGQWRAGVTSWREWEPSIERTREAFARLVGAEADDVAINSTVSGLLSLVAASLPDGAKVVVPEIEFTSNLFPWMVHADRGVTVETVPLGKLAEAIDDRTSLVAFSLVQSSTGEIAPVDDILAAARSHGALVSVDASQAAGWLPFDATRFDFVACVAYKWLMAPRGVAFCYFNPAVSERIRPLQAGWYAGGDIHDTYYGPPLRLASSARRFDVSPAWFSFVGAAPTIELLNEIGVEQIRDHNVRLANRFRDGMGLPPSDSAIVSADTPGAEAALATAGIRAAVRDGRLRASFHLYTTDTDVNRALAALAP